MLFCFRWWCSLFKSRYNKAEPPIIFQFTVANWSLLYFCNCVCVCVLRCVDDKGNKKRIGFFSFASFFFFNNFDIFFDSLMISFRGFVVVVVAFFSLVHSFHSKIFDSHLNQFNIFIYLCLHITNFFWDFSFQWNIEKGGAI